MWADFPKTVSAEGIDYELKDVPIKWYREFAGNFTTHTKKCAGQLMEQINLMESRRNDDKLCSIYPLVLSFGVRQTNDAQVRTTNQTKERASRIEKSYKFALHDKIDFEGEWIG